MLANVLLIVLVVGILLILLFNLVLLRIILRAVRNREQYEAANVVSAADASELNTLMVHLNKEHINLTKYIHSSVHNLRDSLNALSLKSHADYLENKKEMTDLIKTVSEIHKLELARTAAAVPPTQGA